MTASVRAGGPVRSLAEVAGELAHEQSAHYGRWVRDEPVMLTGAEHDLFARTADVLGRCIETYADQWREWMHLMPIADPVAQALDACAGVPHRLGTYRTDYVRDADGRPRLIEITCRFALNGYLTYAVYDEIGRAKWGCGGERYARFLESFDAELAGHSRVHILRGVEWRNESRHLLDLFERSGRQVDFVPPHEIADRLSELAESFCLSELTHDELTELPGDVVRALAVAGVLNDPRTALLAHDKAFFAVLGDVGFRAATLSAEDANLLAELVPATHTRASNPDAWRSARHDRERWILKPRSLGKSEGVRAGIVTSAEDWEGFLDAATSGSILQEWVPQTRERGHVHGVSHDDYLAGTLLFADRSYFGPGVFRTSSHPVTNVVDDRKAVLWPLAAEGPE